MTTEWALREAICEVGRRMYDRNLVGASDGNISIRLAPDRFLCTPSGVSKKFMEPDDIVVADANGDKVSGTGKVTSEFFTHLGAYEERDDIAAVCHAHPPSAVGLMAAGVSMSEWVLPEVVYSLGAIPTADYATPATREGYDVIRPWIRECDAVLLDRHGAVTVGKDLFDAYYKLEKVEHAAQSLAVAYQLGNVRKLSEEEIARLFEAGRNYGVTGKVFGQDDPPSGR